MNSSNQEMVKPTPTFKVGDIVRVLKIPPALNDRAGIDTPGVFERALGKIFRVEGFSELGHLELIIAERHPSKETYQSDTIYIESEFVEAVDNATPAL